MNRTPHLDETPTGRKSRALPIPDLSDEASLFCILHDMEMHELIGHGRQADAALLRQKFYYQLVETTDYPFSVIGRALGRDHTTILHGSRAHAARNGLTLRRALPKGRTFWRSNWRPAWWDEGKPHAQ